MKRLVTIALVSALVGCGSMGAHSKARDASDAQTSSDAELTALRLQLDEQEQELRTLRGQLALARARVQELEGDRRAAAAPSTNTEGGKTLPWSRSGAREPGMEPVLRIDGEIVDERLAVTAGVPDLPVVESQEPVAPSTPAVEEVSVEGYRRGLQLVRDQRFTEALVELDAFASKHPGHAYADNALYWCGEIHFLRREYAEALRYFERVEKLHPWGNKAPDALYRMGQIHSRRGDGARARAYFEKVREQFPETAAARLALREDAS